MAGIYVHIPFCKKACHYCDFHFSTTTNRQQEMVDSISKELVIRKDYLNQQPIETIYFGGGTPSLLTAAQLNQIINQINTSFNVVEDAEITLEANPDDLCKEKLIQLKKAKINRLSVGIQSFIDRDLKWMNRSHSATQAKQCITDAQEIGINNITIDLIYGIPQQSESEWQQNLGTALSLGIQHISSYCLTVEPKTALAHMVKKKEVKQVQDEVAAHQFTTLIDTLAAHGIEQYEISNFSVPGCESKHNTNYWRGVHYLGVGPSAHSFDGNSRQWNVANNNKYLSSIAENTVNFEQEELTEIQKYNEYVLTTLRTKWGIDKKYVLTQFSNEIVDFFQKEAQKQIKNGVLNKIDHHYVLTAKGKFLADRIASDLFYI
ncbi:radical SAM family heme chaperone HemW [Flavobacteriales bacterium]|nr:radical SAM family heme chaperone HemW [Flavobacteriales bacterium]